MRTVCFCNGNIPWGGGEVWHLNAARSLAKRSWRVLMLCHPQGELHARALLEPGLTVLPLAISRLSFLNPLLRRRLRRFFEREKPDALIMNLPSDLKAAGPAAASAGVPKIIYRRGSALPVRNSALNRRLYGQVITRLIVNSQATREQVLVNNPNLLPPERISVLPNGVDVAAFDAALAAAPALFQPASGQKPFVLGNAGRLVRQKGQHLLLQLGRRLLDAGLDLRLVIAGAGERETRLKELAARLGLAERTLFPGFMADLSPFWNGIDLFVLTSLWEGFGNVVIEAGLAGRPVYAFAVSNLPELVRSGENGRLFPLPPDPDGRELWNAGASAELDALAEAVLELAQRDEERKRMGRAGRELAMGYAQERCMDALEALLL